jgi:hypothetical protein
VHVLSSIAAVIVLGDVAVISGALYLLPVLIGRIRQVPDLGSVAVINVLLGWTLIGWAVALALALRSARPRAAAVQVVQNVPAPPSWPGQPPGPGWAGPPGAPPARPGIPSPLVLAPRPSGDRDNAGPGERP